MMDDSSHFCESCGGLCDCGRDTDYETCSFCDACVDAEDAYGNWDCWHEETE